jgi:hypothetical protein
MQLIKANSKALYTYVGPDGDLEWSDGGLPLSGGSGHNIRSYQELLRKCASIKFYNKRFDILYRGQSQDWRAGGRSNLYSSIYRGTSPSITGEPRSKNKKRLLERYIHLDSMEELLVKALPTREVYHDRVLRWSILQHYEICPTPFLDVTGSLQTALSFALEKDPNEGFLYLLGVPHLTGPVSVSLDSGTQAVQLAQLCPPSALRPHFQEAVCLGSYPTADRAAIEGAGTLFDSYVAHNFSCRLTAKFHLINCVSWKNEGFYPMTSRVMYPDEQDEVFKSTKHLRTPPRS